MTATRTAEIPVSAVRVNPQQPRSFFDVEKLEELAETIRLHGQQQAITVHQIEGETEAYVLIAGERRLRAQQLLMDRTRTNDFNPADFELIRAEIRILRSDSLVRDRMIGALIENLFREDLSSGETAAALHALKAETKLSWDGLATSLGLNVANIQKLASIYGHDVVIDALERKVVTQSVAVDLARLGDDELAGELIKRMSALPSVVAPSIVATAKDITKGKPGAPAADRAEMAVAAFLNPAPNAIELSGKSGRKPTTARTTTSRPPAAITLPFAWTKTRNDEDQLEVRPRALATTRLAANKTTYQWTWAEASIEDAAAFRDACANGGEAGAKLWAEWEAKMREVLDAVAAK
jgi:ParB family chromosome partitioning protein